LYKANDNIIIGLIIIIIIIIVTIITIYYNNIACARRHGCISFTAPPPALRTVLTVARNGTAAAYRRPPAGVPPSQIPTTLQPPSTGRPMIDWRAQAPRPLLLPVWTTTDGAVVRAECAAESNSVISSWKTSLSRGWMYRSNSRDMVGLSHSL